MKGGSSYSGSRQNQSYQQQPWSSGTFFTLYKLLYNFKYNFVAIELALIRFDIQTVISSSTDDKV